MINKGNYCYMISSINALNSIDTFKKLNLDNEVYKSIINKDPENVINILIKNDKQQDAEEIITNNIFEYLEKETLEEVKITIDEQKKEIINRYLTERVHENILEIIKMDNTKDMILFLNFIVNQPKIKENIFYSSIMDMFKISYLMFDKANDTSELIKSYSLNIFSYEILVSLNEYINRMLDIQVIIYPKVLMIKTSIKHNYIINKELIINKRKYLLKSCIYYCGNGDCGHYISLCLRDKWMLCNDSHESMYYDSCITSRLNGFKISCCFYEME